jgi:hypothetical protein
MVYVQSDVIFLTHFVLYSRLFLSYYLIFKLYLGFCNIYCNMFSRVDYYCFCYIYRLFLCLQDILILCVIQLFFDFPTLLF